MAAPFLFLISGAFFQYNKNMPIHVIVRVYEELNAFLSSDRRKKDFSLKLGSKSTIQNLIEQLNIPETLIDLVLINGESAYFSADLKSGDRIAIYPVFETFNISEVTMLPNAPLRRLKFLCDIHLGSLSKYMRLLGLDVFYQNNISEDQLIELSLKEKRIILTKNRNLLKNTLIMRGYRVKQSNAKLQLKEIISYFDLKGSLFPFSRCLMCNSLLKPVSKDLLQESLPLYILRTHDKYMKCCGCGRIYWMGSHYKSMMKWIKEV